MTSQAPAGLLDKEKLRIYIRDTHYEFWEGVMAFFVNLVSRQNREWTVD